MRMRFFLFLFLIAVGTIALVAQDKEGRRGFDSPDGRFTLKISLPDEEYADAKLELIERLSGKVVGDLGTDYQSIVSKIKVVWSADSKRVAYRTAGEKEWHTAVYLWNGSLFKLASLPEELPSPRIKFRKSDNEGGVKNYGGGEEPLRWLKSGDLELLSEQTEMAHESGNTYTGKLKITIHFDAQHHASVKTVSKSQTTVD